MNEEDHVVRSVNKAAGPLFADISFSTVTADFVDQRRKNPEIFPSSPPKVDRAMEGLLCNNMPLLPAYCAPSMIDRAYLRIILVLEKFFDLAGAPFRSLRTDKLVASPIYADLADAVHHHGVLKEVQFHEVNAQLPKLPTYAQYAEKQRAICLNAFSSDFACLVMPLNKCVAAISSDPDLDPSHRTLEATLRLIKQQIHKHLLIDSEAFAQTLLAIARTGLIEAATLVRDGALSVEASSFRSKYLVRHRLMALTEEFYLRKAAP